MELLSADRPWRQEYRRLWQQERRFLAENRRPRRDALGERLEAHVPRQLAGTLHGAFVRAFALVFEKGEGVVQWAGRQQAREQAYLVRSCQADLRGDRRSLRAFSRAAAAAGRGSVLQAGAQGVGLGLLGIGLPDIPLFTLTLLKGVRETAVSFGYSGQGPAEQVFTLRLIGTALTQGEELEAGNRALNRFIQEGAWPEPPDADRALEDTARRLSQAMLHWKFLQGIPVAGALGGAWDAVLLSRVQRYAAIKYGRRFLIDRKLGRDL
ncbi:EcsC family protein [uncultured Oscillibacter sp.]|uniref:EcsC family protein n=1 Tax=uncultured Oscillibacter sp. TaxID=876091 RepID=UPI0025E62B91|nr:EcsC family protein [uncultured Oscillibacter sp.]